MSSVVKSYQSFIKQQEKLSEQTATAAPQGAASPEEQALVTDILNLEKQIQQLNATKISKTEELNKMRQAKAAELAKAQQQPVPPSQPIQ